jgi:3-hydroxybutyryl-CoA dehydratase
MKVGDTFSQEWVLAETLYLGFRDLFRDNNPLHVDAAYARSKGFDGAVMHGNILNGFLSYFIGECLPDKNVIIHSQEIKYCQPVYLGDRIVLFAEVAAVFESVRAAEIRFHFENGNKVKVAKGKIQIGLL